MDEVELRKMEWIVEFNRKFGYIREYSEHEKMVGGMKIEYTDAGMVSGLISGKNLEYKAYTVVNLELVNDAIRVLKGMKVNIDMAYLLVFKDEVFPVAVYVPEDEMGVLLAPRVIEE